ncbi:MAG: ECF transporter S component [Clostridia bacterium]|nr:ECF transporter S component [Clostridia bacterium]
MKEKKFFTTKNVTYLSVLLALVIIFQLLASFMKIGTTSFCLVLVPIVLGGIILGARGGAFLGGAFGIIVIVSALIGLDPFTLYMLGDQPFLAVMLCLVKGIAAGVVPALLYKAIAKKSERIAVFVAAAAAPIVNTGIFILGALMMSGVIMDAFTAFDVDVSGMSPFYVVIVLCVGINFFVELMLNLVLAPAAYKVVKITSNRRNTGA